MKRWIGLALLLVASGHVLAQQKLDVAGEWQHPLLDLRFPEQVGEFSRLQITLFSEDYTDGSIGYIFRKPEGRMTITLFVYTHESDIAKTEDELRAHFEDMRAQLGSAFGGTLKPYPGSEFERPGWMAAAAEIDRADGPPIRTLLLLSTCGKWFLKVRASFDPALTARFLSEGQRVLDLINCPADT